MSSEATRRKHTAGLDETPPPVLPHLVVPVRGPGTVTATLDGTDVPPPAAVGEWTRATLGALFDTVTLDRAIPVRIEVREVDGTVFTDLIHARRRATPTPEPGRAQSRRERRARHSKASPVLVEVTGEGFVPGEDIAVAVILTHAEATGTGTGRALLDKRHLDSVLPERSGEVVLYGRVSGTTLIRRLP